MNAKSHRAFSLIELLVSIAIIALITGLSMAAYGKFTARAQNIRCAELVHQTKTALEHICLKDDAWPPILQKEASGGDGRLNAEAGAALAKAGVMLLTTRKDNPNILSGNDRFGVVTPWAMDYIVHHGNSAFKSSKLPGGGTIEDHILHYAIDLDYDGITEVQHGHDGNKALVRAQACVWSYGRDGIPNTKDDIRSWSKGQEMIW